ncbi:pyridoxamine 5'-phosphate oxidase [Flavihumibacter petaseus]|uniref:Pyridoxine/pyridoxamine 5'-phosphate oxidase n=1 Tax=Flavihumibacter petaseus NBRC 106054 TaxID=1220578 RepID=A0A0E9MX37_9BACT|nr:pyridoxamine 5'-phosphate oxidase [Flavihumibacter petaseus]GAO41976.1 pyridoxine/pyridoxamine 5'-phosphate oxidase [Flavihumibacter petaseus NBRC 106054]
MDATISTIRKDYRQLSLDKTDAAADPIRQFSKWWQEAIDSGIEEVNAMTLATASSDGVPSARIVLLKGFDEKGFVFFTNYNSYKAIQLVENPRACLVFFWKELERQVRITGIVEKVSTSESDDYFNSRPESSRIGAWASPQSEVIPGREVLSSNVLNLEKRFAGGAIPRPAHWGGYRVKHVSVEFWQGRPSRLHDRLQYSLNDEGGWTLERLAP